MKNLILEFNQYLKSDKASFVIYADLESLVENNDWNEINSEKQSRINSSEHFTWGFSMSTTLLFKDVRNKHDV